MIVSGTAYTQTVQKIYNLQSVTKIMGKTAIWTIFLFLPPSPSKQYGETMNKSCVKLFYGFATLCRGRGGILNTLFKIPIIFCHWLRILLKVLIKVQKPFIKILRRTYWNISKSNLVKFHVRNRKKLLLFTKFIT